jgi:hypothetical protein
VPPQQNAAWEVPPNDLPTNYVSATALLFEQGLADPRGCEYRTVEIETETGSGEESGTVETRGWVLPGDATNRFAITWNGLIYPVVRVGASADLEADVARQITNNTAAWLKVWFERHWISPVVRSGMNGCLLLRLGRVDLAARYWQAMPEDNYSQSAVFPWPKPNSAPVPSSERKLSEVDPYLTWASEWARGMFEQALNAHIRGDSRLAWIAIQPLHQAQPKIETACAQRGLKLPPNFGSYQRDAKRPYLNFLDQLPQMRADLERRAQEGPRVSVLATGLNNLTNQSQRIAALIRDLDQVTARSPGLSHTLKLTTDPIVAALIQEGEPAVGPLLDCLEADQRLTRATGLETHFRHHRRTIIPVLTVNNAAHAALEQILEAKFPGGVKELRAYWRSHGGLTLEERWFALLNEDLARGRWLEAATLIVQPKKEMPSSANTTANQTNAPALLRGEVLRKKSKPSVSELMARRALEVPEAEPNAYNLPAACALGMTLAAWDGPAAVPVLKTLSQRCAVVMRYTEPHFASWLTKLSLTREQLGDPDPFAEYAAWLPTLAPEAFSHSPGETLAPFDKFPTNLVLQAAANKLFAATNAAWSTLSGLRNSAVQFAASGLFHQPAFRQLLGRELDQKQVCGSVSWQSGRVAYEMNDNWRGSFAYSFPEAAHTPNDSSAELRWCDWIALGLSNGKHIEPYNPFAPVAQRNERLEKIKSVLRQK